MKAQFNEEVMFAGWSDSHNRGPRVSFYLADSASLDAFKLMTVAKGKTAGQRLAMCLVEIADDEQPAQRTQATAPIAQSVVVNKEPVTGLALLAVRWCKEPDFWDWINSLTDLNYLVLIVNESEAKEFVCVCCVIESRNELNVDIKAAAHFENDIRQPYMAYMQKQEAKR